jgi:sodium transport system permease protein
MDLRQIWTLYAHELRSALRERSIVAMSIVVPLVMYPTLLWAVFAGTTFVQGQAERLGVRVALHGLPPVHAGIADSLRGSERVTLSEWEGDPETARLEVARGRLDAFVEFLPPEQEAAALAGNFEVAIAWDELRDRSRGAKGLVEESIASYRARWLDEARTELGIPDPVWVDFAVIREDTATPTEGARFILALVVPFLTLIAVALAAFYPAIDATAGERERRTWETLMTVAAPRKNVAAAKYLYVATFGAVGGLLNLIALALALRWILPPVGGEGEGAAVGGIPLASIPVIAGGTALLGLLVAAGMLVFAVFARNFKEGQSMITPVYMVIILPAFLLQAPDIEFSPALALVPVANVALLIREAIMGSVPLLPGVLTLVSMTVSVGCAVAFAQWVMRREEVLLGATEGGLGTFLRKRFRTRRRDSKQEGSTMREAP